MFGTFQIPALPLRRKKIIGLCILVLCASPGCIASPSVVDVRKASINWNDLQPIDACLPNSRYRVRVEDDHKIKNQTAVKLAVVKAASNVAAKGWVTEVAKNAKRLGCNYNMFKTSGAPVLTVTLKSVEFHGGGMKGMMYIAAFPYVVPAVVYANWDHEHSVTVRADLEFRYAGETLWTAEIWEQSIVERDMRDSWTLVYDEDYEEIAEPLREALEALRDKIFIFTERMNSDLRGQS